MTREGGVGTLPLTGLGSSSAGRLVRKSPAERRALSSSRTGTRSCSSGCRFPRESISPYDLIIDAAGEPKLAKVHERQWFIGSQSSNENHCLSILVRGTERASSGAVGAVPKTGDCRPAHAVVTGPRNRCKERRKSDGIRRGLLTHPSLLPVRPGSSYWTS